MGTYQPTPEQVAARARRRIQQKAYSLECKRMRLERHAARFQRQVYTPQQYGWVDAMQGVLAIAGRWFRA